jgi:hypothetical protein
MRRGLVLLALTLVGAVLVASPAGATFPGRNGPVAFRQFDPFPSWGPRR